MATISRSLRRVEAPLQWIAPLLGVTHFSFVAFTQPLRWEHFVLDALTVILPWAGPRALQFARIAMPLWATAVLYEGQRHWLYLRGTIHTGDLYDHERRLFGVVLPEYFASHTSAVLDLVTGLAYATYLVEFLGLGVVMFFLDRRRCAQLSWAFLVANSIGLVIYVLYPAAPPWYVLAHGPGPADLAALPSAAGAARFDELLGIHFFASFYSRNPNVFGAMPSLHACYPALAAWATWGRGLGWRIGTVAYAALVAFSAVYLVHHYVLDVVAGLVVATVTALIVSAGLEKWSPVEGA